MIPFYSRSYVSIDLSKHSFATAIIFWHYDPVSDRYSTLYNNHNGKTIDEAKAITYEYFNSALRGRSIHDVSLWYEQMGYSESMGYFNASAELKFDITLANFELQRYYFKYYFILNGSFCRYQTCCDCQCS